MRWFLILFGLVIAFFSFFLVVLLKDQGDSYEGIWPVGYLVIAFRESIGDYDTNESIIKNSDYKILIWIVYFIIMILGNVIFMNFIIAVVS